MQDGELRTSYPSKEILQTKTIEQVAEETKPQGATWQIIEDGQSTPELEARNFENLKVAKVSQIKSEAAKRINDAYPDYKQRNIDREAIVTQDMTDVNTMNDYINGIRVKSNELETLVDGYNLEQLEAFDVTDDANWT